MPFNTILLNLSQRKNYLSFKVMNYGCMMSRFQIIFGQNRNTNQKAIPLKMSERLIFYRKKWLNNEKSREAQ